MTMDALEIIDRKLKDLVPGLLSVVHGTLKSCFKLREIFESIQKSNNELRKKLRKMSMADDTFHK